MKIEQDRFKRNILSNASSTALGSIVQLILVALLARLSDTHVFAGYVTAASFVAVGEMASDFGTRIWATQQFALGMHQEKHFLLAIFSKAVYTIIGLIIILILPVQLFSMRDLLFCVAISATQPSTDPFLWFLRGKERLDIEAIIVFTSRVTIALIQAMFVFFGAGLFLLLFIWLAGNIARIVITLMLPPLIHAFNSIKLAMPQFSDVVNIVKLTFPIGSAFLLMTLYQRIGVFVLRQIGTADDVALYGAAFTLVGASGFIGTSITIASFPRLVEALELKDFEKSSNIINKKLILITLIIGSLCIMGMVIAPHALLFLYGTRYLHSGIIMIFLLPGLYYSCLNFGLKYVLNSSGNNWFDLLSVIFGFGAFAAAFLIPHSLSLAVLVALAWSFGELAILVTKMVIIIKQGNIKLVIAKLSTAILVLPVCAFITYFLYR